MKFENTKFSKHAQIKKAASFLSKEGGSILEKELKSEGLQFRIPARGIIDESEQEPVNYPKPNHRASCSN